MFRRGGKVGLGDYPTLDETNNLILIKEKTHNRI